MLSFFGQQVPFAAFRRSGTGARLRMGKRRPWAWRLHGAGAPDYTAKAVATGRTAVAAYHAKMRRLAARRREINTHNDSVRRENIQRRRTNRAGGLVVAEKPRKY